MRAIITVGLGFGDEGKGATVDFLARETNADLVVRYCGGAQAGHNVELPDGRRHTFAQFGAGTLAGARTYLGSRVIISPATMVPEAEHLMQLGVADPWAGLWVHPDCLVATSYHMLMNRLREAARGSGRHGSCGLGIGECRHYWLRYGQDAIFASDLRDTRSLLPKLTLMRERMLLEMQELMRIDAQWSATLHETLPAREADLLRASSGSLRLAERMPACHTAIFEGAQGVLLDEWKGFHPYTTWSTVTTQHAFEILDLDAPEADVAVLGVVRAYSTRHGAGPFPSWSREMSSRMLDRGNPANDWQGAIRFGPLDLVLTEYAARVCPVDALAVTCLDQLPPAARICHRYRTLSRIEAPRGTRQQQQLTELLESCEAVESHTSPSEIVEALDRLAPVAVTAHGATSNDRQWRHSLATDTLRRCSPALAAG